MPIAPITGKLRKGLWRDISIALGLGISAGYAYWYVHSFFLSSLAHCWNKVWLPPSSRYDYTHAHDNPNSISIVQRREEYYLKLEQERTQSQAA